jgi:hypothetical protein
MTDAMKKLREPAAVAAVVFAGLSLLVALLNLLAPPGGSGSFADVAANQVDGFLSVLVAAAAAFGVYLANHAGPVVLKARLITLVALIEFGVAALFGVICVLAMFGASGGQSRFYEFIDAVGRAAVVAVAAWYVWLTWQQHAAVRPAPAAPSWQQSGPGYQQPGQQAPGQQPPPGGFGWTPQQPQQPGGAPLQGIVGPPAPFGGADRTQMLPPIPGGPVNPQQMPQGAGQPPMGAARQPPLPPTMQGYAAQPNPWSPGGPGAQQQSGQQIPGQQPPAAPTQQFPQQQPPQPQPQQQPDQPTPSNPFSVGDWRSE